MVKAFPLLAVDLNLVTTTPSAQWVKQQSNVSTNLRGVLRGFQRADRMLARRRTACQRSHRYGKDNRGWSVGTSNFLEHGKCRRGSINAGGEGAAHST